MTPSYEQKWKVTWDSIRESAPTISVRVAAHGSITVAEAVLNTTLLKSSVSAATLSTLGIPHPHSFVPTPFAADLTLLSNDPPGLEYELGPWQTSIHAAEQPALALGLDVMSLGELRLVSGRMEFFLDLPVQGTW